MSVAAVLLAAGRSTRFGREDKLAAPLSGVPLALHAARRLAVLPVAARIVVAGPAPLDYGGEGFVTVHNARPEAGLGHSIALGVETARRGGAQAVLIALADMPFVSTRHFEALLARYRGADSMAASARGDRISPPALFGSRWFDALEALTGDRGAHDLLDRADRVPAGAGELDDIDRRADLIAAHSVGERAGGQGAGE